MRNLFLWASKKRKKMFRLCGIRNGERSDPFWKGGRSPSLCFGTFANEIKLLLESNTKRLRRVLLRRKLACSRFAFLTQNFKSSPRQTLLWGSFFSLRTYFFRQRKQVKRLDTVHQSIKIILSVNRSRAHCYGLKSKSSGFLKIANSTD